MLCPTLVITGSLIAILLIYALWRWSDDTNLKKINTVIATAAAIGTVGSLVALYLQLRDAHQVLRPWITVTEIAGTVVGPVSPPSTGKKINFTITEKNIGQLPNVGIKVKIEVVKVDDWRPSLTSLCKKEKSEDIGEMDSIFSVVPGGFLEAADRIYDTPQDVIGGNPHVVGCLTYQWERETYQTGFVAPINIYNDGKVTARHIYSISPN